MAKRTTSSARVESTPRRAVHKDVHEPRATSVKGSKSKKRAVPVPPKSTSHVRRAKPVASPPRSAALPKSGAVAKRTPKTAAAPRPAAEASRRGGATAPSEPPHGHASARLPPRIPTPPPLAPRSMELEWTGDPGGSSPPEEAAHDRWVRRGDELLLLLAKHGAADHEYRADLREGRFYWVDPAGRVSAEARARLVCTFVPHTSSVMMGWADPVLCALALPRVEGMAAEVDSVDEESAWGLAMCAAEGTGTDYLYRVRSPSQCVFLALSGLSFMPHRHEIVPSTPVTMVLATLGQARAAAELGAEPVDTLRARLDAAGATLLEQAEYAHRDTDWVARLVRTGKRLGALADRLPRPTFFSVAKGSNTLWLDRRMADDLVESLELLEEEWLQFT